MLNPIILGIISAAAVAIPVQLAYFAESRFHAASAQPGVLLLSAPVFLLGVTGFAMLIQRFLVDRRSGTRSYDGLADLFIHIHSIANLDSFLRWFTRGMNSLLLTFFGGTVGPEGVAAEWAHAAAIKMRVRASSRFEQRRRTDASMALAGAVSAAFGAPFAAVILPLELGIGGPIRPAIVASLTAYVGVRFIAAVFPGLPPLGLAGVMNSVQLGGREILGLLAIALLGGGFAALLTRFIRYTQENLRDLFQTKTWMRMLAAGVLLFFVAMIYKAGHIGPRLLLEKLVWARLPVGELGVFILTQTLTLALVLAGFGTIGILWPLLVLGAGVGVGVDHWLLGSIPGLTAAAGFAGAAALWGGVLGTPLATAVVTFELTGSVQAMVIAGFAAVIGHSVVRFLRTASFIEKNLESRGVTLIDGRSATILESIFVRDAMMSDYETVHEHEPISEIHARLIKSKYPFLPVTSSQGTYRGLLTIDMVQDAWDAQETATLKASNAGLIKFLEAKDLLYRARNDVPTVRGNDRLTKTAGMFEDTPCIPVLTEDSRVAGLLFVYNVRQAYDREVARRSLLDQNREA